MSLTGQEFTSVVSYAKCYNVQLSLHTWCLLPIEFTVRLRIPQKCLLR